MPLDPVPINLVRITVLESGNRSTRMEVEVVNAAVGLVHKTDRLEIPEFRTLGQALGIDSAYGIRTKGEAREYLSEEIVGVVFASSNTQGKVEGVGRWTFEHEEQIAEEFRRRNAHTELETTPGLIRPGKMHPISMRRTGVINGGERMPSDMTQPESYLLERYQRWLGRELLTCAVQHSSDGPTLQIDAFDETECVLIEAKSSSSRTYVLQAIGQLLDYERIIQPTAKRILLPEPPVDDLLELAHSLNIEICYERGDQFILRTVDS